ncbi:MAG: BamA/TamA family outer membrane protein [Cyanobacteria bacterium]|jgi:hemolysin activation/secretion protein|nr:BamA/TamA family outer membrane protein [Cyanobacteria bacterium GSL.Bin21]
MIGMNDLSCPSLCRLYLVALFIFLNWGLLLTKPAFSRNNQINKDHLILFNQYRATVFQGLQITQNLSNESYPVERITVMGSRVFSQADFAPILKSVREGTVTRQQLLAVVQEITKLYLEAGYLTSRAVLVEDSLKTGNIKIQVLEGRLSSIEIEGTDRLAPDYLRSRLALASQPVLNVSRLEDQLRLLRSNPLLDTVEASLKAGENIQESILVVRVQEANPWITRVSVDNYSPPSVGSEEATLTLGHRNLTGNGDTIEAAYSRTLQGGAEDLNLSYSLPINAKNGMIQLRTAFGRNEVIADEFEDLNIEGDFDLIEFNYRQPLLRTPQEEFALSLGFAYQKGETFLLGEPTPFNLGPDEDGNSRTSIIKFGQDYIKRSERGAWGLRSQLSWGTNLLDATENNGDLPDGQFISWLGQIQRVQILSPDQVLIIQADVQLSSDELLPSQQFVIGGGQLIRGYRQNILAGDQGIRLSVEDQITLSKNDAGEPTLKLAPFFDIGAIVNNENNPNQIIQEKTVIAGLGLGILWQPTADLSLRLDYGIPLVDLDNEDNNNLQDEALYFNLIYNP